MSDKKIQIKAPSGLGKRLLKATASYPKPTFQQYIVEKAIKGYGPSQRKTANNVFEVLIARDYFNITATGKHMRDSFTLSSKGRNALEDPNFELTETIEIPAPRRCINY